MGNWLVHHELERQAYWRSDRPAMRFEGATWTFGEYDRRVNRAANALDDAGVGVGDHVIVHGHNHVDLYTLFFAVSKLGAVYSPISTYQSGRNVAYICETLDPAIVCYTADEDVREETLPTVRAEAGEVPFVSLDDAAVGDDPTIEAFLEGASDRAPAGSDDHDAAEPHNVFWTSGTTGRPKGVVRDHKAALHFNDVLLGTFPFGPENVRLTTNDMMFAAPYLQYGLPTVMSGTENVVLRRFDPESVVDHCEAHGITVLMLAFTQGTVLLDYLDETDRDLSLRAIHAVVPSGERARRLAALADDLFQIFATTETGVVAAKRLEEPFDDPPALGTPGRSVDVRLGQAGGAIPTVTEPVRAGDSGELFVRGDTTMTRYVEDDHQSELVTEGWIHTGDSVAVTDEGELVFLGRIDDRIRSGGINIYPSEIESVLLEQPDVEEAVVVGVDDEKWGQRVCALILTDASDTDALESSLDRRCRESDELVDAMRPKTYAFVASQSEIPTGAVNKIKRGAVVEKFLTDD
ncbi:MAG: class I adenylate-forming enzyme family protein [Natronomonas sp.]|uniref:class I adenylate-forming enzyme family protein n=1 Tax=Natronomonas sp. TaxID=2184060 RepID=UPI00286FFA31|nr:class I adenylate-forming enzyme family protein [Natronomonas sp.]MDR9432161.1 class I adenylate-forming enzyme family protein [Natronomonas sp.]